MRGTLLATVGALVLGLSGSAYAGHGHGHHHHHHQGRVVVGPRIGFGAVGVYSPRVYSPRLYAPQYFHDTSHWDYHPTEVIRHGNHFHVQPGHYDFHQSGHWHH